MQLHLIFSKHVQRSILCSINIYFYEKSCWKEKIYNYKAIYFSEKKKKCVIRVGTFHKHNKCQYFPQNCMLLGHSYE